MNRRTARWALILLLSLAVPLKGMAALGLAACGSGQWMLSPIVAVTGVMTGLQLTAPVASAGSDSAGAQADPEPPCHGHLGGTNAAPGDQGMSPSADGDGASPQPVAKKPCTSCAPCCAPVALAAELSLPKTAEASEGVPAVLPLAWSEATQRRLQRPPNR
jgi:hypothetical protein